jgi:hypothetical protein
MKSLLEASSGLTRFSNLLSGWQIEEIEERFQVLNEEKAPINEHTASMLEALDASELRATLYNAIEIGLVPEGFMVPAVENSLKRNLGAIGIGPEAVERLVEVAINADF